MKARLYDNFPDLLKDTRIRWGELEENTKDVKEFGLNGAFSLYLEKEFNVTDKTIQNWFSTNEKRRPKFTLDRLYELSTVLDIPFDVLRTVASKGKITYNPITHFYKEHNIYAQLRSFEIEWVLNKVKFKHFIEPLRMEHVVASVDANTLYEGDRRMPNLNYVVLSAWEEFKGFVVCFPLKPKSGEANNQFILIGYLYSVKDMKILADTWTSSLEVGTRASLYTLDNGEGIHVLGMIETDVLEDRRVTVNFSNKPKEFISIVSYRGDQKVPHVMTLDWKSQRDMIKSLTYRGIISPYVYIFTDHAIPEDDPSWEDPLG